MKYVLPRTIYGNRGDLASRWGVLKALHKLGVDHVSVYRQFPLDLPPLDYHQLEYHGFRNLPPTRIELNLLRRSDVVLWAVGLDMQDDSSLVKLMYLWLIFRMYKSLGLKIVCLFQGAGPIRTRLGRSLASQVLRTADAFVARDPGTASLVGELSSNVDVTIGHDGIFLPGFEEDLVNVSDFRFLDRDSDGPLVGFNLRQWYHFSSSLLPYQFSQKKFKQRSNERMAAVVDAARTLVKYLRDEWAARVLLISAYQPEVVPWEDDQPWLESVKSSFVDDPEVILIDQALSLPEYFSMMAELDLMIGMRLHSTLTALRFGVPSINISYTLKGRDILSRMGLSANVVDLEDFIEAVGPIIARVDQLLNNLAEEKEQVKEIVDKATEENFEILTSIIKSS